MDIKGIDNRNKRNSSTSGCFEYLEELADNKHAPTDDEVTTQINMEMIRIVDRARIKLGNRL
jgi:hypothetical protein